MSTAQGFRHEALMYAGREELLQGTLPFIREGLANDEPTLVVLGSEKINALQDALGADADRVRFADMGEVGANPARIIPAWQEFVDEHAGAGRRLRGIGEPVYPERSSAELVECQRHESLLNLAFAQTPAFHLLCPYDTQALAASVVEEARCSHPYIAADGTRSESGSCRDHEAIAAPFDDPLYEPPADAHKLLFEAGGLSHVRTFVFECASVAGLSIPRAHDVVLAVNEVATNSILHAGGHGALRMWRENGTLISEVRDGGRIEDPLIGRRRPGALAGGHGMWMVNQLCELVQVRSFATGNVVRLHTRCE